MTSPSSAVALLKHAGANDGRMLLPINNPELNTIGLEPFIDEEGKTKWRHVPRACDICHAPKSVDYGKDGVWYCTACWLLEQ